MDKILCTMDEDINKCPHFDKNTKLCCYKMECTFQQVEESVLEYKREERWYEKYYKNTRRI